MTHGPTKYPSKGRCIYCGRHDVPLDDEHILPYSLGGVHVLEKSSCRGCSTVTSQFERSVSRGLWGDARIAYGASSYRKKGRPTIITLPPVEPGQQALSVPYTEYPAAMIWYWMPNAGIVQGLPEDHDLSSKWILKATHDDVKSKAFLEKYPGRLVTRFRHDHISFARMILKIGYCQALTIFDLEEFESICVPRIMGTTGNTKSLRM